MIKYRNTYEETEEAIIINCYNKIGNITGKIIIFLIIILQMLEHMPLLLLGTKKIFLIFNCVIKI